jgi:hypothetical protein
VKYIDILVLTFLFMAGRKMMDMARISWIPPPLDIQQDDVIWLMNK